MLLRATVIAAAIVTATFGSAAPAGAAPGCPGSSGICAVDPPPAPPPPPPPPGPPPPAGATALCRDGAFSFDKHMKDACLLHGGVVQRF